MKVIDVTGLICEGMWTFGELFPKQKFVEHSGFCPGFGDYCYTEIEGMHGQVGTYVETNAHFYGLDDPRSDYVDDIPLEKLTNVPCVVLKVPKDPENYDKPQAITLDELLACPNAECIQPGDAICVCTGWDANWMNDEHFFTKSPYFTKEAMDWIISKKPSILGTDTPAWENLTGDTQEGFFPDFYAAGILMLAPLCNLNEVTYDRAKLTALPLKFKKAAASPVRAVIVED